MTVIGCWHGNAYTIGVGNSQTTPSKPDSLLGEFTKASVNRISKTRKAAARLMLRHIKCLDLDRRAGGCTQKLHKLSQARC